MNITSVCGNELYRIIKGKEFQALTSNKIEGREQYTLEVDTSSVINIFYSDNFAFKFHGAEKISIFGGGLSYKELTDYFSDMARRIDAAFAEGKFTEEEYDALNASFKEFIKLETENWDLDRARIQEMNDRVRASWQSVLNGTFVSTGPAKVIIHDKEAVLKNLEELYQRALVILNQKGFRTDISKMLELIDKNRKDLTIEINSNHVDLIKVDYDKINIPFNAEA